MNVTMEDFMQLQKRVYKLEQKQKESEDEELDWALAQFRYKEKNEDERKALTIIEKRLYSDETK